MSIFNFLLNRTDKDFELKERPLNPIYILDEAYKKEYIKNGFAIIKNAVDDASIQTIVETHSKISKLPEYSDTGKFETTTDFGERAHQMAADAIETVSHKIFDPILDKDKSRLLGGCILIKNAGKQTSYLVPHQDCSMIDEYQNVASYAWIPTEDMTESNGTFLCIPGSHKWAAWQRSSLRGDWPLLKFQKFLANANVMQPIFVNKGDILLFDSALIHGSRDNTSNKIRLAFSITVLEKDADTVQFVQKKDTPKGFVEKYVVDDKYWYGGDFHGRPKGYKKILAEQIHPKRITKKFILDQIEKYS